MLSGPVCVSKVGWLGVWFLLFAVSGEGGDGSIEGEVLDKSSRQPLANSNVYLQNTAIGCATREDGSFQLEPVPQGAYNLIVSHVAYTPETLTVRVAQSQEIDLLILVVQEPVALKGMVVEGARCLGEAVLEKKIIGSQDIRVHAGGFCSDVCRYVQNLPGVTPGLSEESGVFIVRGGAPDENAVFFSGIELLHPFHFHGLSFVVPSDLIERATFYPGAFSVQYGNALSSVMAITPKGSEKREGFWRHDVANFGAGYTGPTVKDVHLLGSLRRTYYRVKFGPLSGSQDLQPEYYYDAVGRLVWDCHPHGFPPIIG